MVYLSLPGTRKKIGHPSKIAQDRPCKTISLYYLKNIFVYYYQTIKCNVEIFIQFHIKSFIWGFLATNTIKTLTKQKTSP